MGGYNVPEKIKGITYIQSDEPVGALIGETWLAPGRKTKILKDDGWYELLMSEEVFNYNPGPGADYGFTPGGWVEDGSNQYIQTSQIERIEFPFDSGNSIVNGTMIDKLYGNAGFNSSTNGFLSGGKTTGGTNVKYSFIQKNNFPFDSGSCTIYGNTSEEKYASGSFNSSKFGYISGGTDINEVAFSNVEKIDFSFSNGNAQYTTSLNVYGVWLTGFNCTTHGLLTSGHRPTGGAATISTTLQRIYFSFDSGSPLVGSVMSTENIYAKSFNSTKHGFIISRTCSNNYCSTIQRCLFPFDHGSTIVTGNISNSLNECGAFNSTNYGYIAGGAEGPDELLTSNIERLAFPFDSGVSIVVGNNVVPRSSFGSFDGTDFSAMFV